MHTHIYNKDTQVYLHKNTHVYVCNIFPQKIHFLKSNSEWDRKDGREEEKTRNSVPFQVLLVFNLNNFKL